MIPRKKTRFNESNTDKGLIKIFRKYEDNPRISTEDILTLATYDQTKDYSQLDWVLERMNSGFWIGFDINHAIKCLDLFNKWKGMLTSEILLDILPKHLLKSPKIQRILLNPQDIRNYESCLEVKSIIELTFGSRDKFTTEYENLLGESKSTFLHRKAEQGTRKVVKDILKIIKTSGLVSDDYILPDYFSGIDGDLYNFGDLQFLVRLEIVFDPSQTENFITTAEIGSEFGYEDEIFIVISLGDNFSEYDYEELQYFLNDYVRHEIEHIVEYLETGEIVKSDDNLTPFEYYTQPSEIRAQKKGFGRRSKLEKKPMSDVISNYLEYRSNIDKLSDTEKEHLVKVLVSEEEVKLRFRTVYEDDKYSVIIPLDINTFCKLGSEKWCTPSYEESFVKKLDGVKYIINDKERFKKLLLIDKGNVPLRFSGDYYRMNDNDMESYSVHKYMRYDLKMQELLKLSYTLSERVEWDMDIPNDVLEGMSDKNELTKVIYDIIQTNTDESRSKLIEFQGDDLEEVSTIPYYIEDNVYVINDNSIEFVIKKEDYESKILNLSDEEEYFYQLGTGGGNYHSYEMDNDEINYIDGYLDNESLNDLRELMVFVGELLPNQQLPNLGDGVLNEFFKKYFEELWDRHLWYILGPLQDGLSENKIKELEETIESSVVFDHTEESDGYVLELTYPQLLYLVNDYNCDTLSELINQPINEISVDLSEVYYNSYEFGDEAISQMNVEFRNVIEKIINEYEDSEDLQNLTTNVSDFERTIKDLGFYQQYGRYVFDSPNGDKKVTITKFEPKTGKVQYHIEGGVGGYTRHNSDLKTFINDVISERLFEGYVILKEEVDNRLKEYCFKRLNKWLLDESDQITHSEYPDYIFFKRKSDGKIIAEIYKENEYFWLDYDNIWSFFERHFNLEYEEIQEIARDWLEETFKLSGYTPISGSCVLPACWRRLSN